MSEQMAGFLSHPFALWLSVLVLPVSVVETQSSPVTPTSPSPVEGGPEPSPSPGPTNPRLPTINPTSIPTTTPYPTDFPSFLLESFDRSRFQQPFEIGAESTGEASFTENQTVAMGELFTSYTPSFVPDGTPVWQVSSLCQVVTQAISEVENSTIFVNRVDYTCEYSSRYVNVTGYTDLFLNYVNSNLRGLRSDLLDLGLPVVQAGEAFVVTVITDEPSASLLPSFSPTASPMRSQKPALPTLFPYDPTPSVSPTQDFNLPTTPLPTMVPSRGISVPAIASIVVLSAVVVLVLIVYFSRRRRRQYLLEMQNKRAGADGGGGLASDGLMPSPSVPPPVGYPHYGDSRTSSFDAEEGVNRNILSPSSSLMSNKSLLSDGGSGLSHPSSNEMDETKNLQDEFDQYKDQNLEQLRSDVEGNLTGFEGIMSAAVTKALMPDDEARADPADLLWGCQGQPTGAEVEASALCEVCDWLKRNENESLERKREFMQDVLNKMVASVRHGVLDADDASRTIHESAALLELQLANELPMTTVIVSGMRMSIDASVIVSVLDEFGDIDTVAVASGERGFAIVRFRNPKSVERALRRYRNDEIVIEDVAIQIRVLTPSGEILSRA